MSAEQVSVMVVDCDVDEAGLESTSCLLLDFSESFALRSLCEFPVGRRIILKAWLPRAQARM
jgi:hypothetical protein